MHMLLNLRRNSAHKYELEVNEAIVRVYCIAQVPNQVPNIFDPNAKTDYILRHIPALPRLCINTRMTHLTRHTTVTPYHL